MTPTVPVFPDHAPQYGASDTYGIAAEWLDGHGDVFDWGCGKEFASRFFYRSRYIGIDGNFSSDPVNLATVNLECDCILMRHVLENNPIAWKQILDNSLRSFRRRMVLVTFTKFVEETHVFKTETYDAPLEYLQFRKSDLTERMGNLLASDRAVITTHPEHVFFLER